MAGCYQRDSKVWITGLCKCSVTFRLLENRENSSLPFFSVLEQDLEVGGHILPSGTVAVLCHMTMQHNPEVGNSFFRQGVCNNQGCISCGILVSGIRARGVCSEHMENMEMFSCSPTYVRSDSQRT